MSDKNLVISLDPYDIDLYNKTPIGISFKIYNPNQGSVMI